MTTFEKKRLTDNQRRLLTELLKKHDEIMNVLIEKAKDTAEMSAPTEKLSTNIEFKNRAISNWKKLKDSCLKQGVYIPIFEAAIGDATKAINRIVPGQSRSNMRWHINMARTVFYSTLLTDETNVKFEYNYHHSDVQP